MAGEEVNAFFRRLIIACKCLPPNAPGNIIGIIGIPVDANWFISPVGKVNTVPSGRTGLGLTLPMAPPIILRFVNYLP